MIIFGKLTFLCANDANTWIHPCENINKDRLFAEYLVSFWIWAFPSINFWGTSQQRMKCLCITYLNRKIRHGPNFCLCSARQPLPRITEFQVRFNASKHTDEDFLPNVPGVSKWFKVVHNETRQEGSCPQKCQSEVFLIVKLSKSHRTFEVI